MDTGNLGDHDSLAQKKKRLLAILLEKEGFTTSTSPSIQPRIRGSAPSPLSFAQERLWFLSQLQPDSSIYNISEAVQVKGPINIEVLELCFTEILRRHEALRTTFSNIEGKPVQVVHSPSPFVFHKLERTPLPEMETMTEIRRFLKFESQRPFDLTKGPLIRGGLIQLGERDHIIVLTMHHIVSDGWSMGLLIRELATLYIAFYAGQPCPYPELILQYSDFAHWQREWLQGEVLENELNYWKENLCGGSSLLEFPTDNPRPLIQTFRGTKQTFHLPLDLVQSLLQLSHGEGVTLFMTLLAAFQTLLYRYTGQEDFCVGSPIANRNRKEIEPLIGFFVNTLVLRADLRGNPTFRQFLQRVREICLGAFAHQDLPFERLVEEINPERNLSYSPLFQVMFVLQSAVNEIQLSGLNINRLEIERETTLFDMSLFLEETSRGIKGKLEYNTDLFESKTIKRMLTYFHKLLEEIVKNPDENIAALTILDEKERQQILINWNDTRRDYPKNKCIHHLFEEQVIRTPDSTAVIFEKNQISFSELNSLANQLAHYLKILGVGPEGLVGICVERSIEMIVGILGILKAGCAYVPLDPTHPKERLLSILEDTQADVLLTQDRLKDGLVQERSKLVFLDTDWEIISKESKENPNIKSSAENLAYVIYTSGSTGKPKGVLIQHGSVINLLWGLKDTVYHKTSSQLRISMNGPLVFDTSVKQIFQLLFGNTLVILPEEARQDIHHFQSYLKRNRVDLLDCTPSQLNLLINAGFLEDPDFYPTHILVGGEKIDEVTWHVLANDSRRNIQNVYGPTECTVISTLCKITPRAKPSIGRPIQNAQIYILDKYLNPVPMGVPGELHIGGDGLARGYLNSPDLNEKKFIRNPFCPRPKSRLYKTGDLARYLPDGKVEFLGRIDRQVKIRGYRIELEEIELTLRKHPNVREGIVLVREDGPEQKRLVAYVISDPSVELTIFDLKTFLNRNLPDYMIPSVFVFLERFPLTSNGKLDWKMLPPPERSHAALANSYVGPRDLLEFQLKQIWEEVLEIEPIGIKANFFEIGGHSLLAIQLMTKIQKHFGKALPVTSLFQEPTIENLAGILRQDRRISISSSLVPLQKNGAKRSFFCVHPVGGNVICYYDLAQYLGTDRPFYALQAPGLEEGKQFFSSIQAMAAHYLKEIREVQPGGPYLLGGWSMGGIVAFEMARQLSLTGGKVDSVIMLDTRVIPSGTSPVAEDDMGLLADLFFKDLCGLLNGNSTFIKDDFRALDYHNKLDSIGDQMKNASLFPSDVEQIYIHRLFEVFKTNLQAMWRYIPDKLSSRIRLFQAIDFPEQEFDFLAKSWEALSTEAVEVYKVPGNHYTMLRKPHVGVLAEQIKACLEE